MPLPSLVLPHCGMLILNHVPPNYKVSKPPFLWFLNVLLYYIPPCIPSTTRWIGGHQRGLCPASGYPVLCCLLCFGVFVGPHSRNNLLVSPVSSLETPGGMRTNFIALLPCCFAACCASRWLPSFPWECAATVQRPLRFHMKAPAGYQQIGASLTIHPPDPPPFNGSISGHAQVFGLAGHMTVPSPHLCNI